jgi:acylphosphatase
VDSNAIIRAHILVRGRVQNVGFRAHVEYHAAQIGGITGWVRNVGADTVETIAEGERARVEKFIEFVKLGPRASRVDDIQVEYQDATGEFKEFGVKASH